MESSLVPSGRRRQRPKSSSAQRKRKLKLKLKRKTRGRLCRVKPTEPLPPIALQRDSGLVLRGAPRLDVAATRTPSHLLGACIDMTNEDPDAMWELDSGPLSRHFFLRSAHYEMRSTRLTCRLVCRAWALAVRTGTAWSCAHVWTKSLDRIHPDVTPWIRRLKLPESSQDFESSSSSEEEDLAGDAIPLFQPAHSSRTWRVWTSQSRGCVPHISPRCHSFVS